MTSITHHPITLVTTLAVAILLSLFLSRRGADGPTSGSPIRPPSTVEVLAGPR